MRLNTKLVKINRTAIILPNNTNIYCSNSIEDIWRAANPRNEIVSSC